MHPVTPVAMAIYNYDGRLGLRGPDGQCRTIGAKQGFQNEVDWLADVYKSVCVEYRKKRKAANKSVDEVVD